MRNIIETKLCIFLIFFLLKRKDSITIHMSEEGFEWKCGNYFIQKDEWLMYAWLGMMYEFSFAFFLFLKTNLNCSPFHCYFKFMESFYFEIFLFFLNHFFGLINLLTNTFFNHFFWNTIWMTCRKLPRAWKGLDEVMKIN